MRSSNEWACPVECEKEFESSMQNEWSMLRVRVQEMRLLSFALFYDLKNRGQKVNMEEEKESVLTPTEKRKTQARR